MENPTLIATAVLLGLGGVSSLVLVIAAKVFYVKEDPRIEAVADALLGANCGGCGYAGCSAAAEAVVKGEAGADVCVAGGFACTVAVAEVMGMEVKETEAEISVPGCRYSTENADLKFQYNGFSNCQAAMLLYGGSKECAIGCLGLGTCASACSFGAITMHHGLPVVNRELCTGCGMCQQVCPKGIISLSSNTKRMISEYTADECTAPCQRTCPAGIDIPKYIQSISAGDFEGAVRIMLEKNPMLSVCGRICPAPCETECRRHLADQPVAINLLKKFVTDYERQKNHRVDVFIAKNTGKKVAVIGGGAQGLTASYFFARLGHGPEIYEAMPELGGILRYVISKDRLPDDILNWEIEGILQAGVKTQTGKQIGKDYSIESLLQQGHDAVVLAGGGMDSRKIRGGAGVKERTVPGILLLIDVLSSYAQGIKTGIGERVCIVEGGTAAVSAAGACLELGAKEITIITGAAELDGDIPEGVHLLTGTIPAGLSGKNGGIVSMDIEKDSERKTLPVDTIILAAGRLPELVIIPVKEEEKITGWQTLETFKAYSENRNEGLFSTVEPGRISDYTAVVKAVGAGRKIAGLVHKYLMGEPLVPQKNLAIESDGIQNVSEIDGVESISRNLPENLNHAEMDIDDTPITDLGFNEKVAVNEASRCMNCGLICYTGVQKQ